MGEPIASVTDTSVRLLGLPATNSLINWNAQWALYPTEMIVVNFGSNCINNYTGVF
jgi:hypothetical protein